jgi:hypothetical protein
LKSGLLGASASGAVLAGPVAAFGLMCPGPGTAFDGFVATGAVPIGAIWAIAGPAVSPVTTLVNSNVRQPRDIDDNPFISNENPSSLQHYNACRAAASRLDDTAIENRVATIVASQTNP